MNIRGYIVLATILTALTTALANPMVASERRSARISDFSRGVLIKRGQNPARPPQQGQSFRSGDRITVPSGSWVMVLCPGDLVPQKIFGDGSSQGFDQICPRPPTKSRSGSPYAYQIGNPASGRDANSLYIISPRQTIVDGSKPTALTWNVVNRSASYQISLIRVLWMNEVTTNQASYSPGDRRSVLTAGTYRLIVEAYNKGKFLSRQEQSLQVTIPPTNAKPLPLAWNSIPDASRYLVSIEGQGVVWQTRSSSSSVTYPNKLPRGRYTLRIIANTAGGEADQQQFLVQDLDDRDSEVSQVKLALTELEKLTLPPVSKALARSQIFADNYMFSNAMSSLLSLTASGNQTIVGYRSLGELQQQVGLTALAKTSYTKALDLAKQQGDMEEQQELQAALACLADERQCSP